MEFDRNVYIFLFLAHINLAIQVCVHVSVAKRSSRYFYDLQSKRHDDMYFLDNYYTQSRSNRCITTTAVTIALLCNATNLIATRRAINIMASPHFFIHTNIQTCDIIMSWSIQNECYHIILCIAYSCRV
ncbi:hypothetical protein BDF22DRAFT_72920 [Syncephalis plumigaleata]|nr:hypothetical protein BDF22DRAFT_72920 [Syncephalis plumigaleata]